MLRRSGLLEDEALSRLDQHCALERVAPVAGLCQLGLVGEPELAGFLQSRMMIPRVDARILRRVDASTLAQVPAELAWAHGVLPVSVDDAGNLTLAMADPTDERAVSAVATHTGAYLVRAVTELSVLRTAVREHYGPPPELDSLPSAAELPPLGPSDPVEANVSTVPLSPEAFAVVLPSLVAANDRDEITETLLDFLAAGFDRVILFIHLRNQLQGRDARGDDLMIDAVTQVRIPTLGDSLFAEVVEAGVPFWGPWPIARSTDAAFAQAMGGINGLALLLPVRLRDRVPLLVFASETDKEVDPEAFMQLAQATSTALERLIFSKKSSKTNLPRQ